MAQWHNGTMAQWHNGTMRRIGIALALSATMLTSACNNKVNAAEHPEVFQCIGAFYWKGYQIRQSSQDIRLADIFTGRAIYETKSVPPSEDVKEYSRRVKMFSVAHMDDSSFMQPFVDSCTATQDNDPDFKKLMANGSIEQVGRSIREEASEKESQQ